MYANNFKGGFLSLLYKDMGKQPRLSWEVTTSGAGVARRVNDEDLRTPVIELLASSASGVSMMECPKEPGVEIRSKLPVLVMIVKNMQKYFSFEVQLRTEDEKLRRVIVGNRHAEPRVSEAVATLPLRLDDGWNQIRFDIANIAERAFGVPLAEVSRVRIQATCRLARVYFATYAEADASSIPPEFLALVPGESPMWASTRSPRWAQAPQWEDAKDAHQTETRQVSPLKPTDGVGFGAESTYSLAHSGQSDGKAPLFMAQSASTPVT